MRKTKIICTLGPASERPNVLRQLIDAGTDVFRLNMSHASHRSVRDIVPQIRAIAKEAQRSVAILLDTQGPAIRTGELKANLELKEGDILELTVGGAKSKEAYSVDVNYDGFINDVSVGDTVLVDNGLIRLKVLEKGKKRLRCRVMIPGTLGSRRHINLPGVHVNLPPLTEKDIADISLGAKLDVDFVALSFVRQKSDLDELRRVLAERESKALIVAKIEDQLAVGAINEMIEGADAIMIARGDLAIECPMEELPIIQRRIVKSCIRLGKPVIVATQMLESMITNPLPTRAEITDVANAAFEQSDAIMLSAETSLGRYPSNASAYLVASPCVSSAAAAPAMQWKQFSRTIGKGPLPPLWLWPIYWSAPRLLSLPGMARWRGTFQISARKRPQFLPSHQAKGFTDNYRFCGASIR